MIDHKKLRKQALAKARAGEIVYMKHRYRGRMIIKVISADIEKLIKWGQKHGIPK